MKSTFNIVIILFFATTFCFSQMGVNTPAPVGVFHVDASKDNNLSGLPTDVQQQNDILIDSLGNMGIGTIQPKKKLHVNTRSESIRLENLSVLPVNSSASGLVIDENGDVYKNNTVSVEGQIIRIGINKSTYPMNIQSALRFSDHSTFVQMRNAPNGAPNFINTITDAYFVTNDTLAAGTGSPSRVTDRIILHPGVYKIQVRLTGNFTTGIPSNAMFLKCIVNNNEYSLVNLSNTSAQASTYYYIDYINITERDQPVDFTLAPSGSNFVTNSSSTPGEGYSYRSLILIQRLR
ncbi:hypothetical protein O2K51_10485 [Apibacter raozihei]|uniref:hypothetical protein n=1 Tax=Apibacter raozihei TaxID=2500547 RepID=UPI000FE3DEE3|nr:hypothetical protein [Apibacter raozihei]